MNESSREIENFRSRCVTSSFILDHFSRQGVDPESLLKGTGLDKAYIDNPYNWISVIKLQRILQNCYRTITNLTLYDWLNISLGLRYSTVGDFLRGITALVGTQTMYMMAPRYIKRSCNYLHLELIEIREASADFRFVFEPAVVPVTSGYTSQITAGMLAVIPTVDQTKDPGVAAILYDQSPLKNIVKKMYSHHGFNFRQKGDVIYIAGKAAGRKICLMEETVGSNKVLSKQYRLSPPYNATLITEDVVHQGVVLLRQGDIFDAPCGRVRISWKADSRNSASPIIAQKDAKLATQTFLLLEEQIKLAEDRFFESEKLREKEKQISQELKTANTILKQEVAERKKAEMLLKAREIEMEIQTANMQEANTALKVLLKKREEDKKDFSEKVLFNIKELIIPYLEKLKKTDLKPTQRAYVEILESNFEELSSPLALKLSYKYFNLTRAEIRVAILIKQGHTTQEIAMLLNLAGRTIDAYRASIRRKLKIKNKKINLCTYLNSI